MEGEEVVDNTLTERRRSEQTTLLLKQIHGYERAPKGLMQLWQNTQQARENSTSKLFLDEGFEAWFAYQLLKSAAENRNHFNGKAECRRVLAELEAAPLDHRVAVAMDVLAQVSPSMRERILRSREKMIKQVPGEGTPSSKRRRMIHDRSPSPGNSAQARSPFVTLDNLVTGRTSTQTVTQEQLTCSPDSSESFADDKHVLVNASLIETTRLFPAYLSGAIKRTSHPHNKHTLVAAIAMTFPNAPVTKRFGCQMALEVTENKVEHLARELFDVHLETTAGLRYVVLPGGAKILPNPRFTLRGCQRSAISPTFGAEMCSALAMSPAYQDDVKQGHNRIDCISMVIADGSHEGAIIFLSLGPREGTLIGDKLYS